MILNKEEAFHIETRKTKKGSTYKVYWYKCNCGQTIKIQLNRLKNTSGKCKRCAQQKEPYSHIYNELKKTKNNVTITFNEFLKIIENNYCHYCNKTLIFNSHSRNINGENISRAYQLDRMDNRKNYSNDNVVTCCWTCNKLKSNIFTYEEFIKLSPILKEIQKERDIKNPNYE